MADELHRAAARLSILVACFGAVLVAVEVHDGRRVSHDASVVLVFVTFVLLAMGVVAHTRTTHHLRRAAQSAPGVPATADVYRASLRAAGESPSILAATRTGVLSICSLSSP